MKISRNRVTFIFVFIFSETHHSTTMQSHYPKSPFTTLLDALTGYFYEYVNARIVK